MVVSREGFNMNENGQCFPERDRSPGGYHNVDDDETGRCIANLHGCPSRIIFRPGLKTCGYKEEVCKTYTGLDECKIRDNEDGITEAALHLIQVIIKVIQMQNYLILLKDT